MPQLVVVMEVSSRNLLDPARRSSIVSPLLPSLNLSEQTHRCLRSSSLFSLFNKSALHSSLDFFALLGGSTTPSARERNGAGFVPFSSVALSEASSGVRCGLDEGPSGREEGPAGGGVEEGGAGFEEEEMGDEVKERTAAGRARGIAEACISLALRPAAVLSIVRAVAGSLAEADRFLTKSGQNRSLDSR